MKIGVMNGDVKGTFVHCRYHPDVVNAFFYHSILLTRTNGDTFGSVVSSANFEPIAKAIIYPIEYLSTRTNLFAKYEHIINEVKLLDPPDNNTKYAKVISDKFNKGIRNPKITKYNMFIYYSLFSQNTAVK